MIITESTKIYNTKEYKEIETRDKKRWVVVYDKVKKIIFHDEVQGVVKSPHSIRAGTKLEIDNYISVNQLTPKPEATEAQL